MSIFTNVIESSNGRFLTVTFVKANGEIRRLNGRIKVHKHLGHTGQKSVDTSKYILMWDAQKKGYRSVNRETILSVNTDGVTIRRNS